MMVCVLQYFFLGMGVKFSRTSEIVWIPALTQEILKKLNLGKFCLLIILYNNII